MKPVINLDEVEMKSHEHGSFGGSYGIISQQIGAKKLGYNLTVLPPGKRVCPYHNHRVNEEMFFILEGTGTLRYGDEKYPLRPNDVIACPPGGRDVAHIIENTGTTVMKYLALSTEGEVDICEYPDSNKVNVMSGPAGKRDMRLIFKADDTVDYYEGEK